MSARCERCGGEFPGGRLPVCPRCLLSPPVVPGGPAEEEGAGTLGGAVVLEEEIGRGAMGTVYRGRHLRLQRSVAVKVLADDLAADPEAARRFLREARALSLLSHPNIVSILDCGEEGGEPYIVMEHVPGGPLSLRVPMPADEALEVAAQICDALAHAHAQGVVHRDIKPANVLLDAEGRVKVSDFGIARLLRPELAGGGWTVTRSGELVATPHYAAPEALAGAPPDPRMDLYSVGVLLYELVTGHLPMGDFAPLPPALDPIVRRALSPDPARRPPDARALARELRAARSGPARGARGGPGDPADDLLPHERTWLSATALALSLATAVALWALLMSLTPRVLGPGDALPLVMLGAEDLGGGRLLSRARFEVWPVLGALLGVTLAILAYGGLRLHWRRAGLERPDPGRPVREARLVALLGLCGASLYLLRRYLEGRGYEAVVIYTPILGGAIEVLGLWLFWTALLQAWRRARPLSREPELWLGVLLLLFPPVHALARHLAAWRP